MIRAFLTQFVLTSQALTCGNHEKGIWWLIPAPHTVVTVSSWNCRKTHVGAGGHPASISWRLDTKESDRPRDTQEIILCFFYKSQWNVVCALVVVEFIQERSHFIIKTEIICSCICINDKLQNNKFLCLRACFFYCSSLRPEAAILFISRNSQLTPKH